MRLAKYLAHAGIASRRQAELLIQQGQVSVNGDVVKTAAVTIDPERDFVELAGQPVIAEEPVYILLYKPAGYISSVRDPQGRPTVLELTTAIKQRIYPVGRLDYDTEGLLLLTNDGQFSNLIIHPRYQIDKKYLAHIEGFPTSKELQALRQGVYLEDGMTAPAQVKLLSKDNNTSTIELTIHEGRKRQVKRMCAAVGHPVIDLKRTALGFLTLNGLAPGEYRLLERQEVELLSDLALNSM